MSKETRDFILSEIERGAKLIEKDESASPEHESQKIKQLIENSIKDGSLTLEEFAEISELNKNKVLKSFKEYSGKVQYFMDKIQSISQEDSDEFKNGLVETQDEIIRSFQDRELDIDSFKFLGTFIEKVIDDYKESKIKNIFDKVLRKKNTKDVSGELVDFMSKSIEENAKKTRKVVHFEFI